MTRTESWLYGIALALLLGWAGADKGPPEHQALQDVADAAAAVEGRP